MKVELREEMQLMRSVLRTIANGATSPTALQAELHKLKPALNQTELSTLRCGLLGRMYELSLMKRKRDGLRMIYEVTPEGQKLLNED